MPLLGGTGGVAHVFASELRQVCKVEHRAAAHEARDLNLPVMIDIIAGPNIAPNRLPAALALENQSVPPVTDFAAMRARILTLLDN